MYVWQAIGRASLPHVQGEEKVVAASGPPTLRQRRLGTELRKLRERAGLSSTAGAARIGVQQARMSMMEAGRHGISDDRVRTLALAYSCDDSDLIEALAAMTGRRGRGWWDEYRELLPPALVEVAEFEADATELRVGVIVTMPGLVQTLDHARAAFQQSVPALRPYEIEHRVSFRIKRQAILFGALPLPLHRDRPRGCLADPSGLP
jgi:transcriptional regulator with XRE-family HTH domain